MRLLNLEKTSNILKIFCIYDKLHTMGFWTLLPAREIVSNLEYLLDSLLRGWTCVYWGKAYKNFFSLYGYTELIRNNSILAEV